MTKKNQVSVSVRLKNLVSVSVEILVSAHLQFIRKFLFEFACVKSRAKFNFKWDSVSDESNRKGWSNTCSCLKLIFLFKFIVINFNYMIPVLIYFWSDIYLEVLVVSLNVWLQWFNGNIYVPADEGALVTGCWPLLGLFHCRGAGLHQSLRRRQLRQ